MATGDRRRRRNVGGALALASLLVAGCGGGRREATHVAKPAHVETGAASWYGRQFAGRRTASGEIFDPASRTAAHRTLPIGAVVRVTNLGNGRSTLVRINDRGPFVTGRILDCSEAVARALGFRRRGVAQVAIDWPGDPAGRALEPGRGRFWLQLGAFESEPKARRLQLLAAEHVGSVAVHRDQPYLRVQAGPYDRLEHAEKALRRLRKAGFQPVVVVLDRPDPSSSP